MKLALELARKGAGRACPNPMVGAVVVRDGKIIGQGYHKCCGSLHAEREALSSCAENPAGADIYVTLEPCCHFGKQPPCTDALIGAGIRRVFMGSGDPNPAVSGKGVQILRDHGIEVITGILQEECEKLNTAFFHYIRTGTPYVTLKYAMTIDGKIAAYTGKSRWITGSEAREHVHRMRHENQAIMVGVGTVLADNPMLNCRIPGGKNPIRIVCDTGLRTPLDSNLVSTAREIPLIIATCCTDEARWSNYIEKGCRILVTDKQDGHLDIKDLMKKLGKEKISSILLEGGGTLGWSAIKAGAVHKVQTYIAPKVLGGEDARTPVEGQGFEDPEHCLKLRNSRILRLGSDILIESEVDTHVYGNN